VSDLLFRPIDELAGLVRSRELSARELVGAALERIEALDPELNAFTFVDPDRALAEADAISRDDPRPYAGVPTAMKDLVPVEGMPMTQGCAAFGDFRAGHDAHVVRRFRDAGFINLGMTNMPEVGAVTVTEPRRHGATRNPWDLERTPGGSSGGAAAAVAAGMVPVAHASDGGGSIRVPAACCGLVGLKPARHRVSLGPELGDHPLVVQNCLTHTVAETAQMLDVLAGYEPGDASWAPPPAESFAEQARREPGGLRIGLALEPPVEGVEPDPLALDGARRAGVLLESLGHHVEDVTPPWRVPGLLENFTAVFGPSVALVVAFGGMVTGREPSPDLVEPLTWAIYERARAQDSLSFALAHAQLQGFARALLTWMEPYDALLTPALAWRPLPIGALDTAAEDLMAEWRRAGEFAPYSAVFNATGQPAVAIPLYQGEDGLPLGVQLAGRPAGEGPLLALAAQLEAAEPWAHRRPPLAG
jgi:amidase